MSRGERVAIFQAIAERAVDADMRAPGQGDREPVGVFNAAAAQKRAIGPR